MRIQTSSFAQRPNNPMKEKTKYFFIYEGSDTEPLYFQGIINNKDNLLINENLSLVSVLRSMGEIGQSHPKHVLNMAMSIINKNNEYITRQELLNNIEDFLNEYELPDKNDLLLLAKQYVEEFANDIINIEELPNIIIDIYKNELYEDLTYNICTYLNTQRRELDYNENVDIINLIVDRDGYKDGEKEFGSFKEKQYDKLVEECNRNKINLYVSNPCFECWLLMHFDEFETLDFEKLRQNKRVSSKKSSKRYAEKQLSNIIGGYDKANLDFEKFSYKIDDAIKREKNYCETLDGLKTNIGSNIGKLIETLRK